MGKVWRKIRSVHARVSLSETVWRRKVWNFKNKFCYFIAEKSLTEKCLTLELNVKLDKLFFASNFSSYTESVWIWIGGRLFFSLLRYSNKEEINIFMSFIFMIKMAKSEHMLVESWKVSLRLTEPRLKNGIKFYGINICSIILYQ